MSTETFTAAARSLVVTPRTGLGMSGYLDRTEVARARLDDLEVNAVWISTRPGDGVLWVSIDVLAVTARMRAAIVAAIGAAAGIHDSHVVVVASHTHSGPGAWHEQIHPVFADQFDSADLRRLAEAIGEGLRGLREGATPSTLTWRTGEVAGVGGNRHRPDGPHDATLGLLEVRDAVTHELTALVYDYACHPTVLGPENTRWSADWVGAARSRVRTALRAEQARLPIVFLQGCAGDASTRFHRLDRSDDELARLGGIVGDSILELLAHPGPPLVPDAVRIDRTVLTLPVRTDAPAPAPSGGEGRLAASQHEGAQSLVALAGADLPGELGLPVSIVGLGTRRWMHLPVELCAEYGLAIAAGHADVRVIGYSDAYVGYIADRQAYRDGQYEALASYFDADTSHRAMAECRAYLGSVYDTSRS